MAQARLTAYGRKGSLDWGSLMGEIFGSAQEKQGRLLRLGCVLENSDEALELASKCLQDSRFGSREEAARAILFLERDSSVSTLLTYIEQYASRSREKILPLLREPVVARYLFQRMCALDHMVREKHPDARAAEREISRISALYQNNVSGDMVFVLIASRDWKSPGPTALEDMLLTMDRRILIEGVRECADLGDALFIRRAAQVMDMLGERSLSVELASMLPPQAWDNESRDFPPGSVQGIPNPLDLPPAPPQDFGTPPPMPVQSPLQTIPPAYGPGAGPDYEQDQDFPPSGLYAPPVSRRAERESQNQGPPPRSAAGSSGPAKTFFAPGETICREGDFGGSCFIIRSGKVRVVKSDARGEEITLAELGENEIVGEMSVIAGLPRSATLIAMEPTELLVVDEANFEKVFKGNPEFSIKMLRILSERLRNSTDTIRRLEDRVKELERHP